MQSDFHTEPQIEQRFIPLKAQILGKVSLIYSKRAGAMAGRVPDLRTGSFLYLKIALLLAQTTCKRLN